MCMLGNMPNSVGWPSSRLSTLTPWSVCKDCGGPERKQGASRGQEAHGSRGCVVQVQSNKGEGSAERTGGCCRCTHLKHGVELDQVGSRREPCQGRGGAGPRDLPELPAHRGEVGAEMRRGKEDDALRGERASRVGVGSYWGRSCGRVECEEEDAPPLRRPPQTPLQHTRACGPAHLCLLQQRSVRPAVLPLLRLRLRQSLRQHLLHEQAAHRVADKHNGPLANAGSEQLAGDSGSGLFQGERLDLQGASGIQGSEKGGVRRVRASGRDGLDRFDDLVQVSKGTD